MLIPAIAPAKLFATVPAKLDRVVSMAYEAPGRERERETEERKERERDRSKRVIKVRQTRITKRR